MIKEDIVNRAAVLLMMIKTTISQMEAKIEELETWLMENPNNMKRSLIETDLNKLRNYLDNKKP